MTYDDLTADQKAKLATYDLYIRGLFASLLKVARDANPAVWNTFASANVTPLMPTDPPQAGQLDAGVVLPTTTGLAAAVPLTAAELAALQEVSYDLQVILATNLPLLVKACGVNAGG